MNDKDAINAMKIMRAILATSDLSEIMKIAKLTPMEAGRAMAILEQEKYVYYNRDRQIKMTRQGYEWYLENVENPILQNDVYEFKDEALTGIRKTRSTKSGFTVSREGRYTQAVLNKNRFSR